VHIEYEYVCVTCVYNFIFTFWNIFWIKEEYAFGIKSDFLNILTLDIYDLKNSSLHHMCLLQKPLSHVWWRHNGCIWSVTMFSWSDITKTLDCDSMILSRPLITNPVSRKGKFIIVRARWIMQSDRCGACVLGSTSRSFCMGSLHHLEYLQVRYICVLFY
jgi:hypothetical protein